MKKHDVIILLSVFLIAAAAFLVRLMLLPGAPSEVVIKQNNNLVYSGPLFENKTISLEGNTILIKNGTVDITYADCKNQICANHKPISKKGESIICLPNKVIAEIK